MPLATKRAIPLGLCRAHAQPKDLGEDGVKAASRRRRWRVAPALSPADHRSTSTQLLPGETSSVAPVALRIADEANPVGSITSPQDLRPAAGARTTRFCRTLTVPVDCAIAAAHGVTRPATTFAPTPPAPTAAHPACRDDRDPPL